MDARFRVERLAGPPPTVQSCGRVQIAFRVDADAIRAAARVEVVMDPHVAHIAVLG